MARKRAAAKAPEKKQKDFDASNDKESDELASVPQSENSAEKSNAGAPKTSSSTKDRSQNPKRNCEDAALEDKPVVNDDEQRCIEECSAPKKHMVTNISPKKSKTVSRSKKVSMAKPKPISETEDEILQTSEDTKTITDSVGDTPENEEDTHEKPNYARAKAAGNAAKTTKPNDPVMGKNEPKVKKATEDKKMRSQAKRSNESTRKKVCDEEGSCPAADPNESLILVYSKFFSFGTFFVCAFGATLFCVSSFFYQM